MDLEPWDPWREFEKVHAQAERLFEAFFAKVQEEDRVPPINFLPATDFIETAEDVRLFLSLPGVVEEDIEIAVEEQTLIVRGQRESPYDLERIQPRLAEWRYGYFERRLALPENLSPQDLSASYRWGVLSIVIPKRKV
jgi:HSP20 family protein